MKKFVKPFDVGQSPIFNEDLEEVLQTPQWDVLEGYFKGLRTGAREGFFVAGGLVTTNASDFDVEEAVVYIDNDFYLLPAQVAITDPSYVVPDVDLVEQRVFKDQALKDIIVTKQAKVQDTIPGSGQYITINRAETQYGWIKYTDHYSLVNGWSETTNQPLRFRKNADGSISFKGRLIFETNAVTSDLFIDAGTSAVPDDITGGDELSPPSASGALHLGTSFVDDHEWENLLAPVTHVSSFGNSIFKMSVPGINTAIATNGGVGVYIDITYSTVDG